MDEATLAALRAALAVSPDNGPLLVTLLRGHVEAGRAADAWDLVRDRAIHEIPAEGRTDAALICLAASRFEEALTLLPDDLPESQVLRARALTSLGRTDEAREQYNAAVAANPTLEDPELAAILRPAERTRGPLRLFRGGGTDEGDEVPDEVLFAPPKERVTFEDVGGLDDLKQRVRRRIILPLQKPSLFERFRKKAGGGVLLYGPPGCGKTLMARATAGEVEARFFNVQISDVLDMWMGESEHKLHDIFDKARSEAPSVLFFDEVEALGGKRQFSRGQSHANVVSQFLSEMDGFNSRNDGVLILGATNVPWAIDPAFRRPGRFDRVLFVPPPDRPARETILRIHLRERPLADDIDPASLARKTSGLSGADLELLVETAVDLAIEESLEHNAEVPIRQAHLVEALDEVKATTTEWLTTARNYARYANDSGQYDEVLEFLKRHGRK